MIRCAIFDMDGTIVDSMKYWFRAASDVVLSFGMTPEEDLPIKSMSMSLSELATYLKDNYGFKYSIEEMCNLFDKAMEKRYSNEVELKPNVINLLNKLKEMNIKLAVASSTSRYLVEICLKRLKIYDYFEYIADARKIVKSKQYPDIYMSCSDYLNVKYDESMILEDLPYGIICTKPKGFKTIGVYDKMSEKLQLAIKNNADLYITDFSDDSIEKIVEFIKNN